MDEVNQGAEVAKYLLGFAAAGGLTYAVGVGGGVRQMVKKIRDPSTKVPDGWLETLIGADALKQMGLAALVELPFVLLSDLPNEAKPFAMAIGPGIVEIYRVGQKSSRELVYRVVEGGYHAFERAHNALQTGRKSSHKQPIRAPG